MTGAIAHTADSVYDSLDDAQQRVARSIFVRLTELGEGTEDTRRRVSLDEIFGSDPDERAGIARVLDVLASARLVTISESSVEVAHEALIRSWPRLRSWLDDDREGLRIMRHVTYSTRDWVDRGRDDSELYRGPRLEAALEWRTQHAAELNPLENEFLDAGQRVLAEESATRARQTRRLRTLLAGTAIALVIALIAGVLAVGQRNRANDSRDREAAVANAETVRRLAVQSGQQQSTSMELALLLAAEANRRADTAETRGALQSALMSNPQLLGFLHGTSESYWSVSMSSTGLIAAGGADGRVDVWRAQDHKLLWSVALGKDHTTVAFAPTGSTLAIDSDADHTLSLWDAESHNQLGEPLTTQTVVARVSSVAFNADGTRISAALQSGEIATWDVATRAEVARGCVSTTGHPWCRWPTARTGGSWSPRPAAATSGSTTPPRTSRPVQRSRPGQRTRPNA